MMRVTTNSTIYTYQKNLLKTSNQLYSAMNSMTTGRNFDSYSADPAAATRAFQIHSSLNATNAQASNNQTVHKKFSTAWDVADDVIDMVTDLGVSPTMKGLNDPSGLSTLNTQGDVIFSGAESIIQSLNSKYDNSFIFGGADTENPPFAIETVGDKHYLTYRNVRIDDPDPNYYTQTYHDANGNEVLDKDGNALTNQQMLDSWKDEHMYVDIGIGFQLDKNGKVVDSTAFDSAISGVDFVGGSGLDADGDPNNAISIMLRLSEIFQGYDQETQTWSSAGDKEDAQRLLNKLNAAQDQLSNQYTQLDTQAKFLETNQSQLESTFYSLNTELNSVEKIDEVEAILTLVSAQTSYNAAIQVGANVVPQSLMDYLN
ncbi:MAG: hypothetical protein Q3X94_08875 [Oscillospiraceae bacterium]|nr:hypothetical protein [Oscillospiraceae bacterium]